MAKDIRSCVATTSCRHAISETMAGRYEAPKLSGVDNDLKAAKLRAQNPELLDAGKFMSLMWDLVDSVLLYSSTVVETKKGPR